MTHGNLTPKARQAKAERAGIEREAAAAKLRPMLPDGIHWTARAGMTESELYEALRGARTALDGPEVPEPNPRPIDWDLAVGEPLSQGRDEGGSR